MKKMLYISFFILSGCTTYITPDIRARNVVTHYLDSVNKIKSIKILSFIGIEKKDIDNSELIKKVESAKSDSEKDVYKKILDSANVGVTPNGFFCEYRIGKLNQAATVRLDNTFSRVVQFTKYSK